jgi:hypothetical protein
VLPAPPSGSEKLLFSLEDIGERLREMGIGRLAIQPHRLVVRFSIRPGDSVGARYPLPVSPQRVQDQRRRGTQSMLARHSVQRTVLHLYTHFPTTVTPVLRTAMARLVTRLNNVIAHGVLELNESDGDVRYRTSIDYGECPDKAVVLAIFEQFVIGHRAIYAEYFDEVAPGATAPGGLKNLQPKKKKKKKKKKKEKKKLYICTFQATGDGGTSSSSSSSLAAPPPPPNAPPVAASSSSGSMRSKAERCARTIVSNTSRIAPTSVHWR